MATVKIETPDLWLLSINFNEERTSESPDPIKVTSKRTVNISDLELKIAGAWEYDILAETMRTRLKVTGIKGTLAFEEKEKVRYKGSEKLMKMMDCDTVTKSQKLKLGMSHVVEARAGRFVDFKQEKLENDIIKRKTANVSDDDCVYGEKENHFYCRFILRFPVNYLTEYCDPKIENKSGDNIQDLIISLCFSYDPEESLHDGTIIYNGKLSVPLKRPKLAKGGDAYSDPWQDEIKGTSAKRTVSYILESYADKMDLQVLKEDLVENKKSQDLGVGRFNDGTNITFENSIEAMRVPVDPNLPDFLEDKDGNLVPVVKEPGNWFLHKNVHIKVLDGDGKDLWKYFQSLRCMRVWISTLGVNHKVLKTELFKKWHDDNFSGRGSWYDVPGLIQLPDFTIWAVERYIGEFTYVVHGFPEFGALFYSVIVDTKPSHARVQLTKPELMTIKQMYARWQSSSTQFKQSTAGYDVDAPYFDMRKLKPKKTSSRKKEKVTP